jgi:hypothetical protein
MSIENKIKPSYWNKMMIKTIQESRQPITTNFVDVQKVMYAAARDLTCGKQHSKEYEQALRELLAAAEKIKKFL